MIFLHRNLDGSLSRQVYLKVNIDLPLDRLDTISSPYLLVSKLESVPRYLLYCTEKSQKFFAFVWCDIEQMCGFYFNMADRLINN